MVVCLRNEERIRINAYEIQRKHPKVSSRFAALDDYRKLPDSWDGSPPLPRSFVPFVGMPVRLQTNDHRPDFCRGMLGTIVAANFSDRMWTVHCDFEAVEHRQFKLVEGIFNIPEHIRPAYAITLHDAQGSQAARVGVVLPPSARCPLLNLESLYTAASRAQKELIIFSRGDTLLDMASHFQHPTPLRCTPLALLLQEGLQHPERGVQAAVGV